jgi:hypothetical protein
MASVKTELHGRLPQVPLSNIEYARAWLAICPSGWEHLEGSGWRLVIHIRFADQAKTRFTLRLVWNSESVDDTFDAQAVRQRLAQVEPRFGSFGDSQFRRVPVAAGLSLAELSKKVEELNAKLRAAAPVGPSAQQLN